MIASTASFEEHPLGFKIRIHISPTKITENHRKIQSHLLDESNWTFFGYFQTLCSELFA